MIKDIPQVQPAPISQLKLIFCAVYHRIVQNIPEIWLFRQLSVILQRRTIKQIRKYGKRNAILSEFLQECTMEEMIEHCAQFVGAVNEGLPSPITKEEYLGQMKMYFP